jgi:hypothetical protein
MLLSGAREIMRMYGTVHNLFIDFKKACDSIRREVFYNIVSEFGISMNVVKGKGKVVPVL